MRPSWRGTVLLGALAISIAGTAAAQQGVAPFRTGADLVVVDAVVVDAQGEAVADLTPGDFTLLENGRPQRLQFVQPVVAHSPRDAAGALPPPADARVPYSTNAPGHARPGRALVLFFDDVHLTQEQGERAKAALERFVTSEAGHGDVLSLVAPGRGLRWHVRLPEGTAELPTILASIRGMHVPDVPHERISDYEAYRIHVMHDEQMAERVGRRFSNFRVAGRDPVDLQRDQGPRPEKKGGTAGLIEPFVQARAAEAYARARARSIVTLDALLETIHAMSVVRARKSIIIMSAGFVLDQELAQFRQVEDAARRANVAVYFIDARGLEAQSALVGAGIGSPLDARDIGAAMANPTLEAEGAATLAETTGGFAVRNRNDLAAGLSRISRESHAYYLLGYVPDARAGDTGFRRLSVKVARANVQVRARKGYQAGGGGFAPLPERAGSGDTLDAAIASPYELSDIPVRAGAYSFGQVESGETSVLVGAETDLRTFAERRNGTGRTVLDLRMRVSDQTTGETRRYERTVEITLHDRGTSSEASAWYPVFNAFELAPGRYQARIAVRDRQSGRIGSITHDFHVPGRADRLSLSSVMLSDTVDNAAEGASGPPKLVPVLRRLFPSGAMLYYQFSIFGAARGADGQPRVLASHAIVDTGGRALKELAPLVVSPGAGGMSRFAGISLAGLPMGDYQLVITATDEISGERVVLREPLAVGSSAHARDR